MKQGLVVLPDDLDLHHALGLSLIRTRRYDDAMPALAKAAALAPDNTRYTYVYAVALHSTGNIKKATFTLEQALQRHPHNREIKTALLSFYRDAGELEKANEIADRLQ